jgi:hypothetical protein
VDRKTSVNPCGVSIDLPRTLSGKIQDVPKEVFTLQAGGTAQMELGCDKDVTSYGNGVKYTTQVYGSGQRKADACPYDIGSYHSGGKGNVLLEDF